MSIIRFFRSRQTSRDRYQTLLRPHIEIMYRMAYRWTLSQHDAEDLVQDVLVRLATRVEEMEQVESLKPWLLRVLYNRYVDLYRRNKASPIADELAADDDEEGTAGLIDSHPDPHDAFRQLESRQTIERALLTLDAEQRDVVLLHDMEGYTAEEVAEIMGTSIGTVKSRLHRAREKLKRALEGPS